MNEKNRPSEKLESMKTPSAKEVEVADTSLNEDNDLLNSEDNDATKDARYEQK